ncbi:MAG: hypothetical protein H7318_03985 [Oligoflexus sp.]|nr:hypothetical protein [Oligoflexus sp.]
MKIRNTIFATLSLMLLQFSCRNASFENVDKDQGNLGKSGSGDGSPEKGAAYGTAADEMPDVTPTTATPAPATATEPMNQPTPLPTKGGQPMPAPAPTPGKEVPVKQTLTVTTPSPEIKAGGIQMPATARLSGLTTAPVVTWKITGPAGKTEIGSIDQNGIYTSPLSNDKTFPVTIIATLVSDPTIVGSTMINVLPKEQIFVRCSRGNMVFPIVADVFQINSTAQALPDFNDANQARKVTTVCMAEYAVAPRNFDSGFPDVPGLVEWFALKTTTQLVIPADGMYTIQLNSDDGSKLYIDGTLVIDNDGQHQAVGTGSDDSLTIGRKEVTLQLLKGDHNLALNYFQGPRFRIALELKWKTPGSTNFVYIPTPSFK